MRRSATACIADTSIPNSPSGRCRPAKKEILYVHQSVANGRAVHRPLRGEHHSPGLTQCKRQVRGVGTNKVVKRSTWRRSIIRRASTKESSICSWKSGTPSAKGLRMPAQRPWAARPLGATSESAHLFRGDCLHCPERSPITAWWPCQQSARGEGTVICLWGRKWTVYDATSEQQTSAIQEASIAYTLFRPRPCRKVDRIPEPAPTSTTTLPSEIRTVLLDRLHVRRRAHAVLEHRLLVGHGAVSRSSGPPPRAWNWWRFPGRF